jgi:hypothetical protein
MSKLDPYLESVVRLDRIQVFPQTASLAHKFNEKYADLALCSDGHVLFKGVGTLDEEWVGKVDDVGAPQTVSDLFVYSLVVGWARSATLTREVCMNVKIGGQRRVINFTGIIPSDNLFLKVGSHIPHHVGYAVTATNLAFKLKGAADRSREAAALWRAVLEGKTAPASLAPPEPVPAA